jgi:predicted RNA-binding protein
MKYNLLSPEHIDETYNNIRNKIHNLTTEIVKKAWKKERLLDEIRAFYAHIILSGVIENFKKQKNLEKLFEVKYRNLELEYNNKSKSRKKNQGAHDTVKEALFKFNFGLGVDRNFPENCESYNYDVLFVSMMKLMSIYKIYTYNSGNTARGCINIIKINDKLFQLNFEYSNRNKTKFSQLLNFSFFKLLFLGNNKT